MTQSLEKTVLPSFYTFSHGYWIKLFDRRATDVSSAKSRPKMCPRRAPTMFTQHLSSNHDEEARTLLLPRTLLHEIAYSIYPYAESTAKQQNSSASSTRTRRSSFLDILNWQLNDCGFCHYVVLTKSAIT